MLSFIPKGKNMFPGFMFATGIEGSYPTIEGGRVRMDEMEKCKHYELWRTDFDLVQELGIQFLRYGPPLHKTWLGHKKYDWSFSDLTFNDLKRRGIIVIADLCHFGVPDWIGNFQNPEFPELFAEYAEAFARRYPWTQLYTPVNEMSICAMSSALNGWWNEQEKSDRSFVRALKHIVRANVLAMYGILNARPDAIFIQSESSEYYHANRPDAIHPAEVMNARRFLPLDLNYGMRINSEMYEYLMDNGMTRDEYHFFLDNHLKHHCIMGSDYYNTNEHLGFRRMVPHASAEKFLDTKKLPHNITTATFCPSCTRKRISKRARTAMRPSIGFGRNGRMSCAYEIMEFRLSASLGTR